MDKLPKDMLAIQLSGLRETAAVRIPVPQINRPDDILLRVAAVGICGSDVHYYTTGRIGSQVVEFPFIVGHEFSGTVVQTGSAVTDLSPGELLAVDPAMPCRQCDQCLAHREHTCRKLRFLGCPGQAEGCLSEYIVMPRHSCFKLPPAINAETAALIEPLSIGLYAVRLAGAMQDCATAILGCGPIGLSIMLCARQSGVRTLAVSDPLAYRRNSALQHGADWADDPANDDFITRLTSFAPDGIDVVFECCGQQSAIDQAIEILKPGGKLVLVGIPEVDRISFNIDLLRRKEIRIINVRRQNECVQQTIDLVAAGAIDPAFMVTHRGPLEDTPRFFELVAGYNDNIIKAMCLNL